MCAAIGASSQELAIQDVQPAVLQDAVEEEQPDTQQPAPEAVDMEDAVRTGAVNKLTVDTLKNWLRTKNISVTKLKKAELIQLVKDNI